VGLQRRVRIARESGHSTAGIRVMTSIAHATIARSSVRDSYGKMKPMANKPDHRTPDRL